MRNRPYFSEDVYRTGKWIVELRERYCTEKHISKTIGIDRNAKKKALREKTSRRVKIKKADNGNRTRLSGLGSRRSTDEPYLHVVNYSTQRKKCKR